MRLLFTSITISVRSAIEIMIWVVVDFHKSRKNNKITSYIRTEPDCFAAPRVRSVKLHSETIFVLYNANK